MKYSTIELTRTDAVATVWLNRPDVRNAFNDTLIAELDAALAELASDSTVGVIVLAARGGVFSAGADLNWMRRMADYSQAENQADAEKLARLLHRLATHPRPTIARVHGACFAGGLGLVAACDIAVAADAATFCLTEVRIGLMPGTIAPYVVRAMGPRAASRYFLTAEVLSAPDARRLGLVHECVADTALDSTIEQIAQQLLLGAAGAIAESKRLIRDVTHAAFDERLIVETAARIATARASADGREGVQSFLERRKPAWVKR
ncbi:MAG TPA: enoyl-CoA hydratase/isomerase family protein [Steroidobacteraceae bacterium]|nr:enoyl-CoA hydratase/isomerase family protein [Steroidobacteraceae bacterium]HRX88278.1 enoyl-CoA hydratase/isomerase family protein [Steroidobacteraceae bacterium]